MSDSSFEIVFRGKLVRDASPDQVKQNLAKLFKTDVQRIDKLFTGSRITLKKGLSQAQAQQYRQALKKAGAIVVVVDAQSKTDRDNQRKQVQSAKAPLQLAPVGTTVIDAVEPSPEPEFDLSAYHMDEPGEKLVESIDIPELEIDLHHLAFDDRDTPNDDSPKPDEPKIDLSKLDFDNSDRPNDTSPPAKTLAINLDQIDFADDNQPIDPGPATTEPDIPIAHLKMDDDLEPPQN